MSLRLCPPQLFILYKTPSFYTIQYETQTDEGQKRSYKVRGPGIGTYRRTVRTKNWYILILSTRRPYKARLRARLR